MPLYLNHNDSSQLRDKTITLKCPHCGVVSGLTAISIPDYNLMLRYQPLLAGIVYQCNSCQYAVFIGFSIEYDSQNKRIIFDEDFFEVEHAQETYDFSYLPQKVALDFREALTCYSNSCFNAFAAMCRRTTQSAIADLNDSETGKGEGKVMAQIKEAESMGIIDETEFEQLKTIILAGHDGAHPNLPAVKADRAAVLLELMKDILYQLFVRKKKIQEATKKRKEAIQREKVNN